MSDTQARPRPRPRPLSFRATSVVLPVLVGAAALLGAVVSSASTSAHDGAHAGGVADIDEGQIPAQAQVLDARSWAVLERPLKQSENDGSVVSPSFHPP